MTLTRRTLLSSAALVPVAASLVAAPAAHAEAPLTPALPAFRRHVKAILSPYGSVPGERGFVPIDHKPGNTYLDSKGVLQYTAANGKSYLHPIAMCQYSMAHLQAYTRDRNPARLATARVQADALAGSFVVRGDAAYLPYRFEWPFHGPDLSPPWYSGMAQGAGVHLMTVLERFTGDAGYLRQADRLFNSFLQPYAGPTLPWVSGVDTNGMLWLDEYPLRTGVTTKVFNGHVFGACGLMRYWERQVALGATTRAAQVQSIIDGAFTTAHFYRNACRMPGTSSSYFVDHKVPTGHYHPVHVSLVNDLFNLTGEVGFATTMDGMINDYPDTQTAGNVVFMPGSYTLYKFDNRGGVLSSMKWTTTRSTQAPASKRIGFTGGVGATGTWFLIAAGGLTGWYIKQTKDQVFYREQCDLHTWKTPRTVVFRPGAPIVGHTFDATSNVVSRTSRTFAKYSQAPSDRRACIRGRQMLHITAGVYANQWVEEGAWAWFA